MEELENMKKAYDEFISKAEELAEKIKEKENEIWKPKNGEEYFYINDDGSIENTDWVDKNLSDKCSYELGNCFKTEEEAEKVKRHLIT